MAYSAREKSLAISLYKSGKSSREVAKQMRMSQPTVSRWCQEAGVPIRLKGGSKPRGIRECTTRFGAIVRERRLALNMSTIALGKTAGISKGFVSQIELGGRRHPSFINVVRLAKALKLTLDELAEAAEIDEQDREQEASS